MISREGCCADWPKPCTYHEGVTDALDTVAPVIDTAKVILEHWRGCNSSWEARDQWNAPMAEDVEKRLRETVEAFEASL